MAFIASSRAGAGEPLVAEELARPRPVLLFDVPVVVLVIGARADEADFSFPLLKGA